VIHAKRDRPAPRRGVDASTVVTSAGPWTTFQEFLEQRFPHVASQEWAQRLAAGDVIDEDGSVIRAETKFRSDRRLHYFRALPTETPIPFEATVLWQDDHLLVADKPHFLPVIPSGKYLHETLLVRLKNQLSLPDLVPLHRIDRDTAGLVLFSVNPATRGTYHALFRDHHMHKEYEAIAPSHPTLTWPQRRVSRIGVSSSHFMQQCELPGEPNAITDMHLVEAHGAWARYRLLPVTGQRHQLRVHMAALGLPLRNDGIYPVLTPETDGDYRHPLQLLALSIAFVDPLTSERRHFESQRSLQTLEDAP
jgi:tRNA pseudouridine32 synthase/23S rRNA pseudouridine746 synthase